MNPHHAALARKLSRSKTGMIVAVAAALAIGAPARAEVSAADAKVGIVDCTPAVPHVGVAARRSTIPDLARPSSRRRLLRNVGPWDCAT